MVDAVEQELRTFAQRLVDLHETTTGLHTQVETRWRGPLRAQGLGVGDLWTDVFEPVRHRLPWSRTWQVRQRPSEAAAKIEWFFANRPDLPPDERPPGAGSSRR